MLSALNSEFGFSHFASFKCQEQSFGQFKGISGDVIEIWFNFWFLRHIFILYYVFLCQMLKQIFLRHMRVFLPLEISTASFKSYIGYIQRIQWECNNKMEYYS